MKIRVIVISVILTALIIVSILMVEERNGLIRHVQICSLGTVLLMQFGDGSADKI